MPRLLDYLSPAYAWLAALDPSLPRALFVALVFATILVWRKVGPNSWKKFSRILPISDADASWFTATVLKLWQALPAVLLGGVYGWLGTGGDLMASLKLALLGLAAPVIHEIAWRYRGELGKPKTPPSDGSKPFGRPEVFPQDENGAPTSLRMSTYEFVAQHLARRGLVMWVAASSLACSSLLPPPKAPCDPMTLSQITAFCSAKAYACGKAGKSEAECTAECDKKLDDRAEECRK